MLNLPKPWFGAISVRNFQSTIQNGQFSLPTCENSRTKWPRCFGFPANRSTEVPVACLTKYSRAWSRSRSISLSDIPGVSPVCK